MRIARTKSERLQACANERGIIAALALNQRDALRKEFAKFRSEAASDTELALFKQKVSHVLSGQARESPPGGMVLLGLSWRQATC